MPVSYRSVVATLAAAATVTIGLDYATLAATGDSLILGRKNFTQETTKLVKKAPGPSLVLKSRGNAKPSLRVSSRARVPSLNADTVDGQHASKLASRAVTFRAGSRGDVLPGVGIWSLNIAPGLHQVTFNVLATPNSAPDQSGTMLCGVVDLSTLGENTHVYAAQSGHAWEGDNGTPIAMSGAEMVRISRDADPGLYCGANTSEYVLYTASVSMTRITSRTVKTARPAPSPFKARGLEAFTIS